MTQFLIWALNERDHWQGKNADRYWQMRRVIDSYLDNST